MEGDPHPRPASAGRVATPTQSPNQAVSPLPQMLDITQARPLRDNLLALLGQQSITLDASSIDRMSTPCAQILLAAGRSAAGRGVPFRILNASAVFRSALTDLGLQPEFSKWMD